MRAADKVGQRVRINKARAFIPAGSRLLDIGSGDGALFRALGDRVSGGVGIDPNATPMEAKGFRVIRGDFPADIGDVEPFDVVVALAVLEHVPLVEQPGFAAACFQLLKPGGTAILTVPSPSVDHIVHFLIWLRLGEGMEMHEHFGFEPGQTIPLFQSAGFHVVKTRSFILGLNHLFVFRRPLDLPAPAPESERQHSSARSA